MKFSRGIGLFVAVVICVVSCTGKPRIIPKPVFKNICIDMLMSDQWMTNNYFARSKMDTMLVYEPIFRKYGYTSYDYDETVRYYLTFPDKYSKIMHEVSVRLDKAGERYALADKIIDGLKNTSKDRHGYVDYSFSDLASSDSLMKYFADSTLTQYAQGEDSLWTY